MYWILLLGLGLFSLLSALLIQKLWKKRLNVTLQFQDSYIYENEDSALREIVANDKWLPLPALEVRISMSRFLSFIGEATDNSGVSDQTYKRDVFALSFRQQITRTLPFTATKRGYYELQQADARAYDFFFRDVGYHSFPQNTALYVYPSQVDARRLDIVCTAITGTVLVQNALFPDPFEFSGIREYQPTDPMNRINWKASSRMSDVMVNQFDSTTNLDLTLVFDLEDSHIWKNDSLLEETIRITSSLAARLVRARMPLMVFGNAALHKEEKSGLFRVDLPAGAARMAELNQRLARIEGASMSCLSLLSAIEPLAKNEQLIVLISKNTDKEIVAQVSRLATPARPLLWIIPINPATERPPITLPSVRTIFWEVQK
ncbi:MAG: DUF58 domain-containing protein [Muribaculaceae bacterium]|nr:DUF58 domain-containing protein [Roseburia sp.]MCM1429939.1 DUF58 domain-containing protein [Muribaculaceae bacterium]MCM1493034.1 DUF58 domain-containing protein [Muribaculaceae bacterium]